jgi:putative transposase
LAPLKAGITSDPAAYRWSSHRADLGVEKARWLTTKPLLRQFEKTAEGAIPGYQKFMTQGAENITQTGVLEIEDVTRSDFR